MQFSNETYDKLNKLHRGLLGIASAVSSLLTVATVIADVLTEQGHGTQHIATITAVLVVAKAVIGQMLIISSEEYWRNIDKGEEE